LVRPGIGVDLQRPDPGIELLGRQLLLQTRSTEIPD